MNPPFEHLIEADFWRELQEIEAEAMGWLPLEPGAWLHGADHQATEIIVVGLPTAQCSGQCVLLVGY